MRICPSTSTKPSAFRSILGLFALASLFAAAPALRASSITYDVTLSPVSGQYAGSGSITLAAPPPSSGTVVYSIANQQLQNLTFNIGDQNFFLSGDPSATVQFTDGKLTKINFIQTVDHAPNRFTLELFSGYTLYGNGFGRTLASGSISAVPDTIPSDDNNTGAGPTDPTPATSPTPEPGSLLLLATALFGGGFLIVRRNRAAHS